MYNGMTDTDRTGVLLTSPAY